MNESECASLLASVQWTDPTNLVSLAVLAFINVLVIVGNCLVIAAVLCSHKLRSVTNFFIVSLAVADLLVGLAVLPFSATWEVFKVECNRFYHYTLPDRTDLCAPHETTRPVQRTKRQGGNNDGDMPRQ
uniref:G-protein coupled receptors family 1 profile domain-containing protein n=1 Tax=Anopheles epiroticus TaxID=199890 RepID=A0A182PK26_9DIPT